MDKQPWEALSEEIQSSTQLNRMLHAETLRQLTKLTGTLSKIDERVHFLETRHDIREGQLNMGLGVGKGVFKIGLVILAALAAGFFGGNAVNENGVKMRNTTILPEEIREVPMEPKDNPSAGDDQ